MTDRTVAILGVGLIGGSLGLALRSLGTYVRGFDRSTTNGEMALRLGCVNEMPQTLEETVSGCELVVMALPVGAIVELLPAVDLATAAESTIIDTGSVKRAVMTVAARLPGSKRVIGGHPIAGKEESGPAAADGKLFRGRQFVLTPLPDTRDAAVEAGLALVDMIEARPCRMSAADHDRVLARISHLPQILSTSLAGLVGPQLPGLSGPGLEDMTRLALSDAALWREILLANSDFVLDAARELSLELERLTSAIGSRDGDVIQNFMESGRQAALKLREAVV